MTRAAGGSAGAGAGGAMCKYSIVQTWLMISIAYQAILAVVVVVAVKLLILTNRVCECRVYYQHFHLYYGC